MNQEPRKATDVLLKLEESVDKLLKIVQTQDLTIKVIANKYSELISLVSKLTNTAVPTAPKISVEAVNTQSLPYVSHVDLEKNVLISAEDTLPVDKSPSGFRRTSRPETFSGDNAYLNKAPGLKDQAIKFPTQIPRANGGAEVISVPETTQQSKKQTTPTEVKSSVKDSGNSVPVRQRIVDGASKSVFLADVEIFNTDSNESISRTRTNGTGKWTASLPVGNYKIVVRKRDSMSKEAKEVIQPLQVDGSSSQIELPMMIIK